MGRSSPEILCGSYLEQAGSEDEKIHRLLLIATHLSTSDVSPSHPSLSSLPPLLVTPPFLHSPSRLLRLHVVLLCTELFYVYAPHPPWDDADTLAIFNQISRQLANLPNCATDAKEFQVYFKILEQLAQVKIGAVLVDLVRTGTSEASLVQAQDTLREFIRTLLSLSNSNASSNTSSNVSAQVEGHAVDAIVGCIDEFDVVSQGVVEEVLTSRTNVAREVLRRTEDRLSHPAATLLDNLLSGEVHAMESCGWEGREVYEVMWNLYGVAPGMLTTVIGRVVGELGSVDHEKRGRAVEFLGRVWGKGDVGGFGGCFREWLRRSCDTDPNIRETMVLSLINFLTSKHAQVDLCRDVNKTLVSIITNDPTLDIRLLAIHQVCDLAIRANDDSSSGDSSSPPISVISMELIRAVGSRVGSKNRTEHRNAISGLSKIYHKHYLSVHLAQVQEGGDDVQIDEILAVLHRECGGDTTPSTTKYGWIPQKVFECVSYSDSADPEMRNRIFHIVDTVLLGTTLTPTARAVGLAMIFHSLQHKDNANRWMCTLFSQRANLQRAIGAYLDARLVAKNCVPGSPEAFTCDAEAMEKLEGVALFVPMMGKSEVFDVLKKLHGAKDKHIFRILSTICTPAHSLGARVRALEELPKRTKSLGNDASAWVKSLAQRCAMGSFFNAESIEHCIILSQESFEADDCESSSLFLECIRTATSVFPALGGTDEGFKNLAEFFDVCRSSSITQEIKREMERFGLVTVISDILAKAASSRPASDDKKVRSKVDESTEILRSQLLRLCTSDGTPEQARNSVAAISSLINPQTQATADLTSHIQKEKREFEPILKALVNPSRLSIPDDETNPKQKGRILSLLSALAAIAEFAPYAFNQPGEGANRLGWGKRALQFALDTVLLGKNTSINNSLEEDGEDESEEEGTPVKRDKSSPSRGKKSTKQSSNVSIHCKMMCGAIEVLACNLKSTIAKLKTDGSRSKNCELEFPSSDHLTEVFGTLVKIIENHGIPPSSVNGRYCKTNADQAELRRCAAVHLIRLSDASLQLEQKYLTPRMWHIMSTALLDCESSVRESVMEELSTLYTGSRFMPSLRFVALVALCVDSEHGHSAANANAANVGRRSGSIKAAATQCIKNIRNTFQSTQAQCRSLGRDAERNFESRLKMKIMPEYCVPYALHLLAFRDEIACAAGVLNAEDSILDEYESSESEASQKVLKKRLKWLFDPLIQSLGESADNISFLLRMVALVGKHPLIDVLRPSVSSLELSLDDDSVNTGASNVKEAAARMQVICQFAREILLSYVKKDVNLTVYPGSIAVPADLFAPRPPSLSPVADEEDDEVELLMEPKKATRRQPKKTTLTSPVVSLAKKTSTPSSRGSSRTKTQPESPEVNDDASVFGEERDDHLNFDESPTQLDEKKDHSRILRVDPSGSEDFANLTMSPISQVESPLMSFKSTKQSSLKKQTTTMDSNDELSSVDSPILPDRAPMSNKLKSATMTTAGEKKNHNAVSIRGDSSATTNKPMKKSCFETPTVAHSPTESRMLSSQASMAKKRKSTTSSSARTLTGKDEKKKKKLTPVSIQVDSAPKTTTRSSAKVEPKIEPYDEFPSTESPILSEPSPKSNKRKSTPSSSTANSSGKDKKKKLTPVSIRENAHVMVNVTNASSSSRETTVNRKKKVAKMKTTPRSKRDEFNFSDSPIKAASKKSKKSPSISSERSLPARKRRVPTKVDVAEEKKSIYSSPSPISQSEPSPFVPRRTRRVRNKS